MNAAFRNLHVALYSLLIFMIFITGCSNNWKPIAPTEKSAQTNTPAESLNKATPLSATGVISLTVTSLNARAIYPGSSFRHLITLKDGSIPLANKTIGIYDPIVKACMIRTTNSKGQVDYVTPTNSSTAPAAYSFVILYGNIRTTSTVAVKVGGTFTLPSFKMDYISSNLVANSTLVAAERTTEQNLGQQVATTVTEAVKFGKDVAVSYLSNPGNLALVAVTTVTCTAGQSIPAAGQAACATGVKLVATGIAKETMKTLAKRLVDANTQWSSTQKQQAKALIDFGSTVYSIASFEPTKGFEMIRSASLGWSVGSAAGNLIYSGSTLKGASCAAPINGTSTVLQMSFYKR